MTFVVALTGSERVLTSRVRGDLRGPYDEDVCLPSWVYEVPGPLGAFFYQILALLVLHLSYLIL